MKKNYIIIAGVCLMSILLSAGIAVIVILQTDALKALAVSDGSTCGATGDLTVAGNLTVDGKITGTGSLSGCYRKSGYKNAEGSTDLSHSISCESGEIAVGGGAYCMGDANPQDTYLKRSSPLSGLSGWEGRCALPSGDWGGSSILRIWVYAICCPR